MKLNKLTESLETLKKDSNLKSKIKTLGVYTDTLVDGSSRVELLLVPSEGVPAKDVEKLSNDIECIIPDSVVYVNLMNLSDRPFLTIW